MAIGFLKMYDSQTVDWSFKNEFTSIDSTQLHFIKAKDAPLRNNAVILSKARDWVRVKYVMPAPGIFEAVRNDSGWTIDGQKTDSVRTWFFLNQLDTVYGSMFVDSVPPYKLLRPEYELTLYTKTGDSIKVQCYIRTNTWFMRSSQSPGNVFDAKVDSLFEKVYVGKARFFPKKVW